MGVSYDWSIRRMGVPRSPHVNQWWDLRLFSVSQIFWLDSRRRVSSSGFQTSHFQICDILKRNVVSYGWHYYEITCVCAAFVKICKQGKHIRLVHQKRRESTSRLLRVRHTIVVKSNSLLHHSSNLQNSVLWLYLTFFFSVNHLFSSSEDYEHALIGYEILSGFLLLI